MEIERQNLHSPFPDFTKIMLDTKTFLIYNRVTKNVFGKFFSGLAMSGEASA